MKENTSIVFILHSLLYIVNGTYFQIHICVLYIIMYFIVILIKCLQYLYITNDVTLLL
jgi:hypothetical protein